MPVPHRQLRHRELREAHVAASHHLATVDAELEEILTRRRACLDTLAHLRTRLNVRYTANHIRRRHHVDEPPVPPAPAQAEPLESIDLRSVCLSVLRRHGPQRLRDLHGLLHCYGYYVASTRPVQRLGDAMAYEERCGRARRVARGTYEAVAEAPEPPRPGWWGPSPEPGPRPLPWSRPVTDPGPPLVDPRVADDPELWSGRAWPDPPERSHPEGTSLPDADATSPRPIGDDSLTNRSQGPQGKVGEDSMGPPGGADTGAGGAPAAQDVDGPVPPWPPGIAGETSALEHEDVCPDDPP